MVIFSRENAMANINGNALKIAPLQQ